MVFSFLYDPVAFRAFQEVFGSPKMPVPPEMASEVRQRKDSESKAVKRESEREAKKAARAAKKSQRKDKVCF